MEAEAEVEADGESDIISDVGGHIVVDGRPLVAAEEEEDLGPASPGPPATP